MAGHEVPIDLLQTPFQTRQPQLIQTAARARTRAEWKAAKPRTRGLTEIERVAAKIQSKFTAEKKGIGRTSAMGGSTAKQDIAMFNEYVDVDGECNHCKDATSTPGHVT